MRKAGETESAAGPLAAFLIANKVVDTGTVVVEQCHGLDRPSLIEVRVQGENVEIVGRCVDTARGFLTVNGRLAKLIHLAILAGWEAIVCLFTSSSALSHSLDGKGHSARSCSGSINLHAPSLREPFGFAVHSEWVDEAAFELHATLPHRLQFLAPAEALLTHPVQGLRLRQIGGGGGAALGREPGPPTRAPLG